MSKIVHLPAESQDRYSPTLTYRGLAGVIRYDPHLPRCFEGIKHNLLAERPTLMRLHAGANYPVIGDKKIQIDQEGQAILVIGYDDEQSAFAVIDPFPRSPGEIPKVEWVPFDNLEITMVDASKGSDTYSAGLDATVMLGDEGSHLVFTVGLPSVRGSLMDHDAIWLEDLHAEAILSFSSQSETHQIAIDGKYRLGQQAEFTLPVPSGAATEITIELKFDATLCGMRPYEYKDAIGVDLSQTIALPVHNLGRVAVNS